MGKLYDKMKMNMDLKGYSERTKSCYLTCMKQFVLHYGMSPEEMGDEEIRKYLHYLTAEKKASQSLVSQNYSALKFFYEKTLHRVWNESKIPRGKRKKTLPQVLSREEVEAIFAAVRNLKHLAIIMTIYSGGLRLNEATHLKAEDIDSKRMAIRVRQGKGDKDRYTLLGQRNLDVLRTYWKVYSPKIWLFPGKSKDETLSHSCVQRAFKAAAKRAGIKKNVSIHTLRHSFATHLLESGVDLYYIQNFLGHKTPSTTAVYLHITGKDFRKIKSPVDFHHDDSDPVL